MKDGPVQQRQLNDGGYIWSRSALSAAELAFLDESLPSTEGRRGGVRDVFDKAPALRAVLTWPGVVDVVQTHVGDAVCVRALLFDKSGNANWRVPWHQDLSVPVDEVPDVWPEGWTGSSVKEGVPHIQPPAAFMEAMLTLRIHVDDCDVEAGAVRCVPGSHRRGRLSEEDIRDLVDNDNHAVMWTAAAGDILAFRPLLLHASSKASSPTRRRILHLEFVPSVLLRSL